MSGPLRGLRVIELAGIGAAPFAAMLLADLGADVLRIEGRRSPVGVEMDRRFDVLLRGRPTIDLDLKEPGNAERVRLLCARADVLIEGWRPGVAERLGVGPDDALARNPRLVYGRMTGWGQSGPLAQVPGHDINYIAVAGALHMCGREGQPPTPPLNMLGDFGGGGMLLAFGIMSALWEASGSGMGQVVDAAMLDGAALLTTVFAGLRAGGMWSDERGTNLTDTGCPFYEVYETADHEYVAIGAVEAKFQSELIKFLEVDIEPDSRTRADDWPATKRKLADVFRSRTLQDWQDLLEGTDTCFAPVLPPDRAARHPHNQFRQTFVEVDGIVQPAPAPRFSRTSADRPLGPADPNSREASHWWSEIAGGVSNVAD